MRILQATSEFFPYSKTGGLADMVAGLSGALVEAGQEVTVASPLYQGIRSRLPSLEAFGPEILLPLGSQDFSGQWWKFTESNGLVLLFLEQEHFYGRNGIYMEDGDGYWDNPERFMFFSKAVAQLAGNYDVVHVHDWQTAFVPMLLKASSDRNDIPRTVLTIHNLAYQGQCEGARFQISNLPPEQFHQEGPEFWGSMNFLKAGLHFSDAITTVSPRYAAEILTPEFGEGMEGVLQSRASVLRGILNGVDYDEWNTDNNPHLAASYGPGNLSGKRECKRALQEQVGLPLKDVPLFGMVSRLAEQKGTDILIEALNGILGETDMQFVGLGSGDLRLADELSKLQREYPRQFVFFDGYSNPMAHQIEAGADYYVMPSRFEPCGLNQLYSLRYGTIPIVNGVGGLKDTVQDLTHTEPTGIVLEHLSVVELNKWLLEACAIYGTKRHLKMVEAAFRQDFGWGKPCSEYMDTYQN